MAKIRRIYMDTAAATPVDKRVVRAMLPFLNGNFGNASSIHEEGLKAASAISEARKKVAEIIGAHPDEIIFTSGGTEANNIALQGIGGPIISTDMEHSSVSELAKKLKMTFVPVEEIKSALTSETKLVSVIYANNEIGTIQQIREISKMIRNFRKEDNSQFPYFHIDACQAGRFLDLNAARLGVDLMTLNGSKIYGPKGVGCLYVRRGIKLNPLFLGGGQERGLRSGTENVAGIIGFTEALTICHKLKEVETKKLMVLRDRLRNGLLKIEGAKLNGQLNNCLPNNVNVSFDGIEAEQLVIELDAKGVACSAGSACSYNKPEESRDIMGVRFSLGRDTTKSDIDYVIKITSKIISKLKQQNNYARNTIT